MHLEATNKEKRSPWRIALPILGIILAILYLVLTPRNIPNLSVHSNPARSYAEALQRIDSLKAHEPANLNPVCKTQLMTHDKKAGRAIILVHGYTSCPEQFNMLGRRFYDSGYNVLIAPLPHHGLTDRITEEHSQLTAEEMTVYADETVDIAQGLGDEVMMMGLSAGGVIAAWAAQNRSDLALAVIISPAFGYKAVPTPLTAAAMNIYNRLSHSYGWWDATLQDKAGMPYAYPRYSKQALAQILRLGFATEAEAKHAAPAARKMVVVFNPNDSSISNERTTEFVKIWRAHGANLVTYEFDAALKLKHYFIDPNKPGQKIDSVYPRLMSLVSH